MTCDVMDAGLGAADDGLMTQLVAADVVRSYCRAWRRGDTGAILALYHPDLTLDWPGRHRLAGRHVGQQAAVGALLALQEITNRVPIDIADVLVGQHSVMALVTERWRTDPNDEQDESIELRRVLDFTVCDGQLHTCHVFESDQPAVDEWIGRSPESVSEV